MSDYQEEEAIDYNKLLEELEKIDDLDTLDDIENMLLSEKQNKTEALNRIRHQNAELKDELNRDKCQIKELDQLHSDEQEKIENLRENIRLKQLEILQEERQRVEDLDQFELEVANITKQFVTAPNQYEASYLNEKINNLNKMLDEKKSELQQLMEKVTKAKEEFEEPIEMESMVLPLKVFDDAITGIKSSMNNLAQLLDKMSKDVDKLNFDMKRITK